MYTLCAISICLIIVGIVLISIYINNRNTNSSNSESIVYDTYTSEINSMFDYSDYFWYSSDNLSEYSLRFLGEISTKGSLFLHLNASNMYGTYHKEGDKLIFQVDSEQFSFSGEIILLDKTILMTIPDSTLYNIVFDVYI